MASPGFDQSSQPAVAIIEAFGPFFKVLVTIVCLAAWGCDGNVDGKRGA